MSFGSFSLLIGFAAGLAGQVALAEGRFGGPTDVDLELVLAADVSGSVTTGLVEAQRRGFADAFRDAGLRRAMRSGPTGRIAVVYVEWAGAEAQRVVVPWTVMSDTRDVEEFAQALEGAETAPPGGETSISGALDFARALIETNGIDGLRRVIDLASNGTNSDGPALTAARAGLWDEAITVNGLILPGRSYEETGPYGTIFAGYDGPLDGYFEREVIGGPGAFVVAVDPERGFRDAIRRKLVLEVAWVDTGADVGADAGAETGVGEGSVR